MGRKQVDEIICDGCGRRAWRMESLPDRLKEETGWHSIVPSRITRRAFASRYLCPKCTEYLRDRSRQLRTFLLGAGEDPAVRLWQGLSEDQDIRTGFLLVTIDQADTTVFDEMNPVVVVGEA